MSDSEDSREEAPRRRQVAGDDDDDEEDEDKSGVKGADDGSEEEAGGGGGDDGSEEEEEDDEDEDEEEEEEEAPRKVKSKEKQKSSRGGKEKKGRKRERGGRRRKDKRDAALRRYVDLEANVGGDEDEDDDGDYDTGEAAEARKLERDLIYKPRQKSAFETLVLNKEDADIEEYYRDRARPMYRDSRAIYETAKGARATTTVAKQAIMPTVGLDPRMWRLKTRPGKEVYVIMSIMNMAVRNAEKGIKVGITSAVHGGGSGVVYVEAFSESDVSACVAHIGMLLSRKPELIGLEVMPEVMDVANKLPKRIEKGQWVRMKRGLYKGDLARVLDLVEGGDKYLIELIPRIDYASLVQNNMRDNSFYIAKKGVRPEQRFFSAADASKYGIRVEEERSPLLKDLGKGDLYFDRMFLGQHGNNDRYRQGYLIKAVKAATQLETEGVNPEPEEVATFGLGALADALDRAEAAAQIEEATLVAQAGAEEEEKKKLSRRFNLSDRVVVIRGELKNLEAYVVETNLAAGTVTLANFRRAVPGMPDRVEMPASDLAHYIDIGKHVKVLDGVHAGATGMVQAVREDPAHGSGEFVYLMTDLEQVEIVVRRDQVKISDDMESGHSEEAGLTAFTLVQYENKRVGLIIAIHPGVLDVLDMDNRSDRVDRRSVTPFISRSSFATDRYQQQIRVGDTVTLEDRGARNVRGTVKFIYNGTLWIQSKQVTNNNGWVVSRADNARVEGAANRGSKPVQVAFNTTIQASGGRGGGDSRFNDMRGGGGRGRGFGGGRGGRGEPVHPWLNKTVRVIKHAQHKGRTGKVVSVNGARFTVKLDKLNAGHTTVQLTEDQIKVADDTGRQQGRDSDFDHYGPRGGQTPGRGGQTPGYGGMTPGYGGMTPGYGGMTPGVGGHTPAHGGMTPGYGGMTPGYYGNQTPARDGGRSPYHN